MTDTTANTINIPSFEPPSSDDSDNEIWLLRAPANVDVSELLNNTQLNFTSDPSSNNNILSRFTSSDGTGEEYALSLGDVNESQNLRLLVPDKKSADDSSSSDSDSSSSSSEEEDKKSASNNILVPYAHPFKRQIHITIANKEQSDLAVAPSQSSAPKPALKDEDTKVVNGTVEKMRLAYVPVAQRKGLKRRWNMPGGSWNMPGGKIVNDQSSTTAATTTTSTKDSTPSHKRTRAEQEADMDGKEEGDNVVSVGKSSKKSSSKKSKKKKSRKSK